MTERAPLTLQPGPATWGVQIVLIPVPMLLFGIAGLCRSGDVLDVVAGNGYQTVDALGPKCGDDAGRPAAPVIAGEDGALHPESVHQREEVGPKRCLLSATRRRRVAEPGPA